MIIENRRTANNADMYILTFVNNASNEFVSLNTTTAINIKRGGKIAPIKLKRKMLDLLSFKNSISIKVNIQIT